MASIVLLGVLQVFIVKTGKLAVTIHRKCSILETDATFFVPKGEGCEVMLPSHEKSLNLCWGSHFESAA